MTQLKNQADLTTATILFDELRSIDSVLKDLGADPSGEFWDFSIELWPAPVPHKNGGFSVTGVSQVHRARLPACTRGVVLEFLKKSRDEIRIKLSQLGFTAD